MTTMMTRITQRQKKGFKPASPGEVMYQRSGACLCGAITFDATTRDAKVGACHCTQCQRWVGGGPLYSIGVSQIAFKGEDNIREFALSDWGLRAFCQNCGSTLYWRMKDGPVKHIAPGLLDEQSDLRLTEEIFVDYRPDWVRAEPGADQSTEAQQMALLKEYLDAKNTE